MAKKSPIQIKVKLLDERAKMPLVTKGNACFDFYAIEDTQIAPVDAGVGTLVRTGLAFEIPEGYHMKLFMRSSYGLKTPYILGNCVGIIDSSYRGEVQGIFKVFTKTMGFCDNAYTIFKGDRFMQGLIEKNVDVEIKKVKELSETERGEGGFGSTGE